MKITLTTLLLSTFFFLGCTDTPISPIEQDSHSVQLIKLPLKDDLPAGSVVSVTKEIDGKKGGEIVLNEEYETEDGDTVKIDVKIKFKKTSFEGKVDITLTTDDEHAAISFSPGMVFDKPAELDMKFEGLNLESLNIGRGNCDFVFIADDASTEAVSYNALHVNEKKGKIWVTKANINHFSRYGFVNRQS